MAQAKIIQSRKDGFCMKCLGPIEEGETIAYQYGFGAAHIECPDDVIVEEFQEYVNIGTDGKDDWAIRVIRPDGALELEGEDVQILTSRGNLKTETLGAIAQAFEERHAIYRKAEQPSGGVTEPGVYETPDGTVYVVKPNKAGTNLYAKRLVEINAERALEEGGRVNIEFQYEAGAIYRLKPEWKMEYERAKELTIRYGRCIVCGRKLKAAQSVEQGIGPVCIKSFRGYVPQPVVTEPEEGGDIVMPSATQAIEDMSIEDIDKLERMLEQLKERRS